MHVREGGSEYWKRERSGDLEGGIMRGWAKKCCQWAIWQLAECRVAVRGIVGASWFAGDGHYVC